MADVIVPIWLFWTLIAFLFIFLASAFLIWFYFWNKEKSDKILMFDKNMKWELIPVNTRYSEFYERNKKTYFYKEGLGFVNRLGKTLYIFSENNSSPMLIKNYIADWLSPETLKGVINNKLVQMMLKPKDAMMDMLLLLGAIGGMIAGLSSAVILLMQLGVI